MDGTPQHEGLKVASLVRSGEAQDAAIQRGPGIFESRGIGNSYLVVTRDGDVLVNAGALSDARRGRDLFAKVSANPIRKIILTQSHANQYGGLELYATPDTEVIAHRIYPEDRYYSEMLSAHYRRGSRRIFGEITGRAEDIVPTREVAPNVLIDDHHAFELGGRPFELHWTPGGETRSALIVWLPQDRIAIVGNLFGPLFGNQPNLNTLRGDKPRSALEFIASIRRVAALAPELILTGHEAISGAEHIQQEIGRIADSVQWIHDRTIEGMNAGKDLRSLMRDVVPPPALRLTEDYGKVAWNVRTIWHEYSGWFDPARGLGELYATAPWSIAPAIAELAGGADRMAQRAMQFVAEDKPLEALHLLEIALAATPDSAAAKGAKREALELLKHRGGNNLWERMSIAAEMRELDP